MTDNKINATGERAAIGGYLPQFSEFAWYAYKALINNTLVWVKVADPEAEKLDDIHYSTLSEIHAYQVKWTISDDIISYTDFKNLLPSIASSWLKIRRTYFHEGKTVIAHLLTNKPCSTKDQIKAKGKNVGSFSEFVSEVYTALRLNEKPQAKWRPVIKDLIKELKLSENDFYSFIKHFDFSPNHSPKEFTVTQAEIDKQQRDLNELRSFLLEKVAAPEREVIFTKEDLINRLGWASRFQTRFNHDLIVDQKRYQPIATTIKHLSACFDKNDNGYIFLKGGPGTGKSSLITQWLKNRPEQIVKYYAFDYNNPSSQFNYYERGDSVSLYFDLVVQIKGNGVYGSDILPYRDLAFLKKIFSQQLENLGKLYIKQGQKTIIVIDGLDHIPREYKTGTNNFLRDLPHPDSLPKGVYILLSSQTYELDGLNEYIKGEWKKKNRSLNISSLTRKDVFKYIESTLIEKVSNKHKQEIYKVSQGHPLYLSYLLEQIKISIDIDRLLSTYVNINGNIEIYYQSIWATIKDNESLVDFLGLIARINGSINPNFITEWNYSYTVLNSFKTKAIFLFNETQNSWFFFHNSFKQYLINETATNPLTNTFDPNKNDEYHIKLANFYSASSLVPTWNKCYHLYMASRYDEFIIEVTPEKLTEQFIGFRPVEELRRDIKFGLEIAAQREDTRLLVRYLLSQAELERKLYNINRYDVAERLIILGDTSVAQSYYRHDNTLLSSVKNALKAVRLFFKNGESVEASILLNLINLDFIDENSITITEDYRPDEIREILNEWVCTASLFNSIESIIEKINNLGFAEKIKITNQNSPDTIKIDLIEELGYYLIESTRWDDLDLVLKLSHKYRIRTFGLHQLAIRECLRESNNFKAIEYLSSIIKDFPLESTPDKGKIFIADLIYNVTQDLDLVKEWIKDIKHPMVIDKDPLLYRDILNVLNPIVRHYKLLCLCGIEVPISVAVTIFTDKNDKGVIEEFGKMLCRIARIQSEVLSGKKITDFIAIVRPIVIFFYQRAGERNMYMHQVLASRDEYFSYLIFVARLSGQDNLNLLALYLFKEFSENPSQWQTEIRRKILLLLLENGYEQKDLLVEILLSIEKSMLDNKDMDSRISECLLQSNAWLELGDKDSAKSWVKRSIRESLGVSYSKDYQFNAWTKWLNSINSVRPDEAKDNILWFLNKLEYVKNTTDGASYDLSRNLLRTTMKWNFSAGEEQLEWQLKHSLITFDAAIEIFIEEYLNYAENEEELNRIGMLYFDILIPISVHPSMSTFEKFVIKSHSILGDIFFDKYLKLIIENIEKHLLEELRFSFLNWLNDFVINNKQLITTYYPGFVLSHNSKPEPNNYPNTLLTTEGTHFTEEQIINKINSYEDLLSIIKEANVNYNYNWVNTIKKISNTLTTKQIFELTQIELSKRVELYEYLSELAYNKSEFSLAEDIANKCIALSEKTGWVSYYDGGTRIKGFKALRRINQEKATKMAFSVFAHDASSKTLPALYIEVLHDILEVITTTYDVEEIWKEIFDYLNRIISYINLEYELPKLISDNNTLSDNLTQLIVFLSKNPIREVSENAIKTLSILIIDNDERAKLEVINFAKGNEDHKMLFVATMMHIRYINPSVLLFFKTDLNTLAQSNNYLIRKNCSTLLKIIGEESPVIPNRGLPTIYQIHITPISLGTVIIDDNNTSISEIDKVIRLYDDYILRRIAAISDLSTLNLKYRLFALMKEVGNSSQWTDEYEEEQRKYLDSLNLRFPYPRPRVISASHALMHLISELIDSDKIEEEHIEIELRSYDYHVCHFDEIPRPNFIHTLKLGKPSLTDKEWIEASDKHARLDEKLIQYKSGWKVIAEYTRLISLNWGKPSEEFMWQLKRASEESELDDYIFDPLFNVLTNEYYNVSIPRLNIIMMRDHRFSQFDVKSKWLAVNPSFARHLGWEPDYSKMFAWKNDQGLTMVESIYWVNGNTNTPPPRLYSEAGEGWAVVVSDEGLKQILNACEDYSCYIEKRIIRMNDNQQKKFVLDKNVDL